MFRKYFKEIMEGVIILLQIILIGLFLYFNIYENDSNDDIVYEDDNINIENAITIETNMINVEVKGEVQNPGTYHVKNDLIVKDILDLAILKDTSYTDNINMAKKVSDEMVIVVYSKSEYQKKSNNEVTIVYKENVCNCPSYDISLCDENTSSVIETGNGNSVITEDNNYSGLSDETNTLININTASKEVLMTISGIGESKAENIIKYRQENGNFKDTSEIVNVSGISEATYEKIKDLITV